MNSEESLHAAAALEEPSRSPWMDDVAAAPLRPLAADRTADVCIVGAGIAGLTTAYLLAKAGRSVVVLDDKPVAGGMSQRTSAHLSCWIDDGYAELEKAHGIEASRLAAESHRAAIERIAAIVDQEAIDCDFERVDGYLFMAGETGLKTLAEERDAAERAGLTVTSVPGLPVPTMSSVPALRFAGQAQIHPTKYLAGLASVLLREGVEIYTGTHVTAVRGGRQALVRSREGHGVEASAVVVATNSPVNNLAVLHTKLAPYTTYVIALEIPAHSVLSALYWDTLDPYHYVRVQRGAAGSRHDLLIVGGEDHKSAQKHDQPHRHQRLETWARTLFPQAGVVHYRWSGQVMETLDGLAYIGRNPLDADNVYVITGDSGMGLTHGTLGAKLIADQILGDPNPWEALYDPARKPLRGLPVFVSENLNVARQYSHWLAPEKQLALSTLTPGSGAVVQEGLAKRAIYREPDGSLHSCSAVCSHLGCVVAWNELEHAWECPCHGSRFNPRGAVINGPAVRDLADPHRLEEAPAHPPPDSGVLP